MLLEAADLAFAYPGAPRVLIVPGIMGSQLGLSRNAPLPNDIVWLDPLDIQHGKLAVLRMSAAAPIVPLGVVLFSYLRLKLHLRVAGFAVEFHDYDWRLSIVQSGRALAERLRTLRPARVAIVAHSMGTMLTLEALRQLNARYGEAAADRIGAIVFASPDIDIDVFSSSIERMGPLARRITVITATNDRALELSSKLAGGVRRVGAAEKAQLERLGLRVIDASQQGWGLINHDLFLSNPDVRQVVRRAIDSRTALGAWRMHVRGLVLGQSAVVTAAAPAMSK